MRYLFIHQNFPGQFRHLAHALASDAQHEVVGVGEARNLQARGSPLPGVRVVGYASPVAANDQTHAYIRPFEAHVYRGQQVAKVLEQLRSENFVPDVVVVHPGWGEALFVADIFPRAKVVTYLEYFYRAHGGDVGFDPEFPAPPSDALRVRMQNSTQLHSLYACDAALSPTHWQKAGYPREVQDKITVIHEGVNTQQLRPNPHAWLQLGALRLRPGDEVVTYVARNLEPYRGFHTLMRSIARLQALRPQARVLIVGGDGVSYGRPVQPPMTYRKLYCAEVQHDVDWSRVHFVGKIAYDLYVQVLQVSAVHIYLTYPFVLSWSMLEAMAAGCLLVASDTAPVREVIAHGVNGLLVDFFDAQALAETVAQALAQPARYAPLRAQARRTACERYDLHTVCLPQQLQFLQTL